MSQPKLISPMLDNFLMGEPFSDHNGVRCCPAMKKDTNEKYIVKIISIPASQVQLDALLLTGAYSDKESAAAYFKELSDDVISEVNILQKLSQLEGFIPYEECQVAEMEDGTGYDVYLLSSYKKTLEHFFRKSAMTHLGALNLGLDMCAALAVCRRSGYMYVDLRPDNIFVFGDKEFRIGDLGFLSLESLRYTSLPDKYRSAYTAPEITDAFSALNTTLDIYAAGLILYQAYNNGELPVAVEGESFPAPAYGDYEISEIILKACSPDPKDRWQDPIQMGQALVSYMQRNGANDTPIIPVTVPENVYTEESFEEENESGAYLEVETVEPNAESAETNPDDINTAEEPESVVESDGAENRSEAVNESAVAEELIFAEDEQGNLTFLEETNEDSDAGETIPGSDPSDLDYDEVTEEVSQMLNQADELIAHDAPDPVVAPEPIEISVPDPIDIDTSAEAPEEADAAQITQDNSEESADEAVIVDASENPPTEEIVPANISADESSAEETAPSKTSHWVRNLIILMIICGVLLAGWLFYRNYYLQPVSITLDDTDGVLTVLVDSEIDERKLTVICSDTYGIQHTAPVRNGKAIFEELAPNSAYNVQVTIEGFHQLVGKTSTGYTTPAQTNIVQISAVTGPEDGSAVIGFTVDGPDSQQWIVQYVSDGEDVKEIVFTGHMVTISGLTIGKDYDFTLIPCDDVMLTGSNLITHTASKIICASDLIVTNFANSTLSVSWDVPENTQVASWTVRCYNTNGYDKSIVTSDLNAEFTDIIHTDGYTVEVTAAGMSVCQRTQITENSINLSNLTVVPSDPGTLRLTWDSSTAIDPAGWKLQFSVNGGELQEISGITENEVTVPSVTPEGEYTFTLLSVSGNTVFNGTLTCTAPEAQDFESFGITADDMDFYMCRTPDVSPWGVDDISRFDYVTDFTVGEKASFLIHLRDNAAMTDEPLNVLFMIKDTDGATLSSMSADYVWSDFWNGDYATVDLPWLPDTTGHYQVVICFNGMLAFDLNFNIQ